MVERDAGGLFKKGHSGNPGGRPALPEEFRLKGPERLARIAKMAEDDTHARQFEALRWCLEQQYGKAPQSQTTTGGGLQEAVMRFLLGPTGIEDTEDDDNEEAE